MYEKLTRELSFAQVTLELISAGTDWQAVFQGGDRPHLGCTVLAQPRLSLTGSGETSCTSSVINAAGHKDEVICREIAELLCSRLGATVVCSGGFHADGITGDQIRQVREAARALAAGWLDQQSRPAPDSQVTG